MLRLARARINLVSSIVLAIAVIAGLGQGRLAAAGSAQFSLEPSSSAVEDNQSFSADLFVSSEASIYSVELQLTVENLRYERYEAPSPPSFDYNEAVEPTVSNVSISATHVGDRSSSGKVKIGTLHFTVAGQAGEAITLAVTGATAIDTSLQPMPVTSTNLSFPILAAGSLPASGQSPDSTVTIPEETEARNVEQGEFDIIKSLAVGLIEGSNRNPASVASGEANSRQAYRVLAGVLLVASLFVLGAAVLKKRRKRLLHKLAG